jgi:segregation and condensation protein B
MKKPDRREVPAEASEASEPATAESEESASLADDDWDGPTREIAPEEVEALAVKSKDHVEGQDGAPVVEAHADEDVTQPGVATDDRTPVTDDGGAPEVAPDDVWGEAADVSIEAAPPSEAEREASAAWEASGAPASEGEGASAAPEGEANGAVPDDGASPGRLESVLESLLFASDRPLTLTDLKRLTGERQAAKLSAALESLKARREESGIQIVPVAGGWQLRTHPENAAWVSRLIAGKPMRLSRAMLETLAIVAYRQPVTRPEIDEIRGVDCGPVLGTLLDRGLVRIIGKKEEVGRPILYGTTPEFLRTFSLRDLNELPTLREFHELSEAHRDEVAKVDADRAPDGESVGDGAAPPSAPPRRPAVVHQAEPDEDDALLTELERATSAATAATTAPDPTAAPAPLPDAVPPPAPSTSDEPAGGAE